MRINEIHLSDFKRFTDLTITGLSDKTKLVVLVGPNGCGKSSLFDAMKLWNYFGGRVIDDDDLHYDKGQETILDVDSHVNISFFKKTMGNRIKRQKRFIFEQHIEILQKLTCKH